MAKVTRGGHSFAIMLVTRNSSIAIAVAILWCAQVWERRKAPNASSMVLAMVHAGGIAWAPW